MRTGRFDDRRRLRDSKIGKEGRDGNRRDQHAFYGIGIQPPTNSSYDSSVVRGLEYYTGPVYECEVMLETNDEKGQPVRFGSVRRRRRL